MPRIRPTNSKMRVDYGRRGYIQHNKYVLFTLLYIFWNTMDEI
jgi:hypothetical protein